MKAKGIFSVLIVSLFVLCSLSAITAEGSTFNNDEKSVTMEFNLTDYGKVSNVTIQPMVDILNKGFCINSFSCTNNFDYEARIDKMSYSYGCERTMDGDRISKDNLYMVSGNFAIKLTANMKDAKLGIGARSYLKDLDSKTARDYETAVEKPFDLGDVVEFTGSINLCYHETMSYDLYKNSGQKYLEKEGMTDIKEYMVLNGKVKCRGDVFEFNLVLSEDVVTGTEYVYAKNLEDVKAKDPCKSREYATGSVSVVGLLGKNVDPGKHVPYDMIRYDKRLNENGPETDDKARFVPETMVMMLSKEPTVHSLPLTKELDKESDDVIKDTIAKNNGKLSYDLKDFNRLALEIDLLFVSDGGDWSSTVFLIGIVVVVAVIIILMFLWRQNSP